MTQVTWPMYEYQRSVSRLAYVRRQLQLFAKLYVDASGPLPQTAAPWYYDENCAFVAVCRRICLVWCSQEVLTEICSVMADSWDRECTRRYRKNPYKRSWTGRRAQTRATFLRRVGLLVCY